MKRARVTLINSGTGDVAYLSTSQSPEWPLEYETAKGTFTTNKPHWSGAGVLFAAGSTASFECPVPVGSQKFRISILYTPISRAERLAFDLNAPLLLDSIRSVQNFTGRKNGEREFKSKWWVVEPEVH